MRERILKVLRTSDLSDKEKEELILREIEKREEERDSRECQRTGILVFGVSFLCTWLLCRKIF